MRYFHNTGYLFLEKAVRILVHLFVWAAVIRYLGPAQFGMFSYALSLVLLFGVLSDLGLDFVVIKELVEKADLKNRILGSTFFLQFSGALLTILLIVVTTFIFKIDIFLRSVIIIMSLRLLFQSLNAIDCYFQSKVLSKYTVYAQMLALGAISTLCLLFIHWKLPLIYFAYVAVFELAFTSLAFLFFYNRSGEHISSWEINSDMAKELLKKSWPLIISGISISIYMRIDQIMIKEMLGLAEVGYYSVATRVSEILYSVPIIVTGSLFPAIISAKLADHDLYIKRLQVLNSFLFWLAVLISVIFTLVAPFLITFLFGREYSPAIGVLYIHIWTSIFVFLGVARSKWAVTENLQMYVMWSTVAAAIINIILNFTLIPVFGIKGAALATLFAQFVANVLSNLFYKKMHEAFFIQMESVNFIRILKNLKYLKIA